jgi:hypothetical protein
MKQRNAHEQLQAVPAMVMPADHTITPGGDSKVRRKVLKWMHYGASASPVNCSTDLHKAAASSHDESAAAVGITAAAARLAHGSPTVAARVPSRFAAAPTSAVPQCPVPEPACPGKASGAIKDPLSTTKQKAAKLWRHCKQCADHRLVHLCCEWHVMQNDVDQVYLPLTEADGPCSATHCHRRLSTLFL